MNLIKKHKGKIIAGIIVIILLAVSFFCGGSPAQPPKDLSESNVKNTEITTETASSNNSDMPDESMSSDALSKEEISADSDASAVLTEQTDSPIPNGQAEKSPEATAPETNAPKADIQPSAPASVPSVDNKAENKADPSAGKSSSDSVKNQSTGEASNTKLPKSSNQTKELTCTISVKCNTAIGKSAKKGSVIPDTGVIFSEKTVEFFEGESVFNVLVREMKKNKIHLEFVNVPVYNSAYIEGIGNLYEFDCGELSGWMYKVNGIFPNFGSSNYEIKPGDKIEWVYTCDLGKDVGGEYASRNGRTD